MLKSRRIQERAAEFLPDGTLQVAAISAAFVSAVKQCTEESAQSSASNSVIVDIISYYLQGDLEISPLLEMIKSADLSSHEVASSVLADVLWLLGTQLSPDEKAPSDEAKANQWTNLCNLTRSIHAESLIPGDTLKLSLEFNLLCAAGIMKDETAIRQKLVKCNTQLMYRQQKYNLLREESEGYSKLFTLLCSLPAPPQDATMHIRYMTSVIGYFDLDPNRVIDVILDAFEQQLWNMSYIEVLQVFKRASIVHILGFKFSRYHAPAAAEPVVAAAKVPTPTAKDKGKASVAADPVPEVEFVPKAPRSLYLLAAVLIAHDLATPAELIPYLNPTAADTGAACAAETATLTAELKQYGVVSLSAKSSDAAPPPAPAAAGGIAPGLPKSREYADGNQLFGLLAALYELKLLSAANEIEKVLVGGGCLLASSFCQEVRESLIGLIMWRTDPLYAPLGFLKYGFAAGQSSGSATCSSSELPCLPSQCSQVQDTDMFMSEVGPMLHTLSHHLGTSPELFTRTCRILERIVTLHCGVSAGGDDAMDIDAEQGSTSQSPLPAECIDLLTRVMLPSLTRSKSVAAPCAQLLWSVLRLLPFQTRFSLYEEWKGSGLGKEGLRAVEHERKDIFVLFAEAKVLNYAKAQLKRLSKDNVKQMSRSLSMATHSCPLISYTHILNSIQVFDNLIPFVVDALKYTTDLSRDVMAYALIVQLQKDSEKLKPGDTHYTQWFASLAKFIATFYRKYPTTCLEGLLHFLVGSLSKGESLDLLVLRELLTKMGACETMLDLSHNQLEGFSGGKALQAETMGGLVKEGVPKKAVKCLRDELSKTQTAFPLLYLISKIRSTIIFNLETTELKLVSHMYDVCQDVLMQFTEFLVMGGLNGCSNTERNEKLEMFARTFPSLDELIQVGGLSVAVAFQLVRPLVRLALQSCLPATDATKSEKDNIVAAAAACNSVENCPPLWQRWHPFSPSILGALAAAGPEEGWPEEISMEFFSMFWSLSTYDLMLPVSRYQLEIRRLRERLSELDGSGKPSADDVDKTKTQRAGEVKKVSTNLKALHEEMDFQKRHVDIVMELMLLRKDSFFSTADEKTAQALYEHFVQHCVLPRLFLSPVDAIFGNQFFLLLHTIKTPKYNFQSFLEKFMKLIIPLIFSSTEYEASFLGHAINDVMMLVNRWASDPDAFAREMHHANFQKFTAIFGMWNIRLKNVIKNGIESKEYMIIRSSMVLLSKAATNFPSRKKVGMVVLEAVENLEKAETGRSDLSLMAKSLTTMLKRRMPSWIDDDVKKAAPIAPPPPPAPNAAPATIAEPAAKNDSVASAPSNQSKKSNRGNANGDKNGGGTDRDTSERDGRAKDVRGSNDQKEKGAGKDNGRPPRAESRGELAPAAAVESRSSRDKDIKDDRAPRSRSRDRPSNRSGDSGREQGEISSKHDKSSSRPAKRDREESGSTTKADHKHGDRDRDAPRQGSSSSVPSKEEAKTDDKNNGTSKKPMSSRLGSGSTVSSNDLKEQPRDQHGGRGGSRGVEKDSVREESEAKRPAKRARR